MHDDGFGGGSTRGRDSPDLSSGTTSLLNPPQQYRLVEVQANLSFGLRALNLSNRTPFFLVVGITRMFVWLSVAIGCAYIKVNVWAPCSHQA